MPSSLLSLLQVDGGDVFIADDRVERPLQGLSACLLG